MKFIELYEHVADERYAEELVDLIVKDGKSFLNIASYVPIRGISKFYDARDKVSFLKYPKNRKPMNTDIEDQKVVDEWLKRHGTKALRSNSIYLTLSPADAQFYAGEYGNVYAIIPLGKINYHWYKDRLELIFNLTIKRYRKEGMSSKDAVNKIMTDATPQLDTGWSEWENLSGHEMVLNSSNGYIVIQLDYYEKYVYPELRKNGYDLKVKK